jgi:hypothetical protein
VCRTVLQVDRLDALAQQLLTLELAIPGLYATVLKLVAGREATLGGPWLVATFLLWFIALVTTLLTLFPRTYRVNPDRLWQTPAENNAVGISIQTFYQRSAHSKRGVLSVATVAFFGGIACAGMSVL